MLEEEEMTYIERMEKENCKLTVKFNRLTSFLGGHKFRELNKCQQQLLVLQHNAMNTYKNVLEMRIENEKGLM